MKNKIIKYSLMWIALWFSSVTIYASETDSLTYYLRMAAQNNPQVKAAFAGYKASLERIPQAGAYADPELEIGYFLEPMETLMGKQKADLTLMQMFPWFGTQKAARTEASEMARMKYEEFRDSRNNLYYSVKSQWYQLCNLNEQYKNTAANIELLKQLEQLAIRRFFCSWKPCRNNCTPTGSICRSECFGCLFRNVGNGWYGHLFKYWHINYTACFRREYGPYGIHGKQWSNWWIV